MGRPNRILVVDDHPSDRNIITNFLDGAGHSYESATDGFQALERLDSGFDLVLLDVIMPGIDGFEVARRIRENPKFGDIPILMVTVLADKVSRLCAVKAGANDFITKPIDRLELSVRIESLLKMKEAQDAIKRHRAELEETVERRTSELREGEGKYKALIETTNTGYLMLNAQGRVTDANMEYVRLSGHNMLVDILDRSVVEWTAEYDRERTCAEVEKCLQRGFVRGFEVDYVDKHGRITTVEINGTVITSGQSLKIVVLCRDITERRQAEDALRDSEARFHAFMEYSPMVAFMKDDQRRFVYANGKMLNQFDAIKKDWKGKRSEEIFQPDITGRFVGNDDLVLKQDRLFEYTIPTPNPQGSINHWWTFEFPLQDPKGQRYVGGVALDITGRIRGEQEKEACQSKLFQSQKMEALVTLVGGIAHDFNNMLQIIIGFSQLLLEKRKNGEPGYEQLRTVIEAGKSGADLVKMLMAYCKQAPRCPVDMDLNHEIRRLTALMPVTFPHVIQIDVDLADGRAMIHADPTQIYQVLMNLALNGVEAMPNGGWLKIATTTVSLDDEYCKSQHGAKPGEYVMLSVSDTGRGMDERTLVKAFDPFYSTKERGSTRGTGLGLSVVQGIVEQHGGHATCESKLGKGTKFRIYFPAIEVSQTAAKKTVQSFRSRGTETILVVEDVPSVALFEREILTHAGYTVIIATNGREALDIYKTRREEISLVILDLVMPGMSGKDCLMELVRINPLVKVLIASGYSKSDELKDKISPFVKGFVHKPFGITQLMTSVGSVLGDN
jgi:two-component system, cell cycle sensor histidine kinase and response regulator CckA